MRTWRVLVVSETVPRGNDPRVLLLTELADDTRFGILELLERSPMTATALARQLDVSPTQLANHLRRLRDANLVSVEHHSRLAVYELAEPGLREIFSMLNGLRQRPSRPSDPAPASGRCYDHLAGPIGVALFDHLVLKGAIEPRRGEGTITLGPAAPDTFRSLGVDGPLTAARRISAFACLDSTLRKPHLGGHLGAQLADSLVHQGWIESSANTRQVSLTDAGQAALTRLGIEI